MSKSDSTPVSETIYEACTPLHIIEGRRSRWVRWFAWHPVRSEQGYWIWFRSTWRRHFLAPIWFDAAPVGGWFQYSDERRGYWEARP